MDVVSALRMLDSAATAASAPQMNIMRPHHTWRRFWCKPEESYSLFDAGFLSDPETEYGKYLQPNAVATEALREFPCLALLGEPGMGKSTALVHERSSLGAEGKLVVFVELLREPTVDRIRHALDREQGYPNWQRGDGLLYLFLDALDEGMLRNPNLAQEIGALSSSLDTTRMRLRITCRTLEWPQSLEETLAGVWKTGFSKYELLPLRRLDVVAAATDYSIDPIAFVREVIARDAQPLATRPISLRFLLQTFLIDGRLPESKLRLYDEGCRLLCSDEGTWERGRPTPDAFRRMAIAARIAAAGTFTNRHLITRDTLRSDDAVDVSALIGGVENVHGASYRVDGVAVADALNGSALFSARAGDTFGWAHQSYREFLAAWYLAHRDLDVALVESFYFQAQGPVPAALREVAAWHATFVPAVFDMMLARDPDVLMKSDTAAVSAPVRRALVDALLLRMDTFQTHDRNYSYDHYRRLGHPGLADQLRPYIHSRTKNVIVRRAAIDIAGACRVEGLTMDLGVLVHEGAENQQVREGAARALRSFDSVEARDVLKQALVGGLEPDPDDEILGTALRALWPSHIDATTLFAALRWPRRDNLVGAYDRFISALPDTIGPSELGPALAWAASKVDAVEYSAVARLRDHIIVVALSNLEDASTAKVFAQIAVEAFKRYHDFFARRPRRESGELRDVLTADKLHLLVKALLDQGIYDERLAARLIFNNPPLLSMSDMAWLCERATYDGNGIHEPVFAEFAKQLIMVFDYPSTVEGADALAMAFERSPVFRSILAPFLAPVELGSEQAGERRRAWTDAEERRRQFEQKERDRSAQKVSGTDERLTFVRQTLAAPQAVSWLQLCFTMMDSGFEPVERTDVWLRLTGAEQENVRSAAVAYLEAPSEPDEDWIDTTSIPGVAIAAEAAFALLATSTGLEAVSQQGWCRWCHVLVGFHHDQALIRERLVPEALRQCPAKLLSALVRVVRRDDRLHGFVTSLDVLPVPMPVEIQAALTDILGDLSDRSWQSVVNALIESGNVAAMTAAVTALESHKPARAAAAAQAVLPRQPERWLTAIDRMQRDREFAVSFMSALVDEEREQIWQSAAQLDEMVAAELYLTLLRMFPPEDDAERNRIEMTAVTPRDQVARMRDRIGGALVTSGSMNALEWLVEQEPDREYLRWMLVDARTNRADASWNPIALEAFLESTGVLFAVPKEDADGVSVVFAFPLSSPALLAEFLENALAGTKVAPGESGVFVTGPSTAIRALIDMAERDALEVSGNRFLGIRLGSEWLFEAVPAVTIREVKHRDVDPDELRQLLAKVDVLLMTATQRETAAVLSAMSPLPGETDLVIGTLSVDSYTIGKLGCYAVAHCQSGMGSTASDGSFATSCDAIKDVAPKVIFLVGIAFGVRRRDQRIGDVLVAKHIRPYAMYKARADTIEERGYTIPASVQLMKWMQDRTREWRFLRADGSAARIITPGEVLSGEVLVNSIEFRNWLTDRFPTALGGEMEGIGGYAANHRYNVCHMLLVKAICDWADGCKNDRAQPFAAAAAVSAVEHLLSRPYILTPLGIAMLT